MPSLKKYRPLKRNPNRHTQRGLGMLDAAMSRHGYVAPMTAAADGTVLDGNARLETVATKFADVEPIVVEHDGSRPVIMVRTDIPDEDDPRARDIMVSANRIAEVDLDWDLDVLKGFVTDGLDIDLLGGMGDFLPDDDKADDEPDLDKADELRAKYSTETGQLWRLGRHFLLVGDSTKPGDVQRVMGGELADICMTSPPYLQRRAYRDGGGVQDWDGLMRDVFSNLPMSPSGQVLVNLGLIHQGELISYWDEWIAWMREQGWRRFGWYVWDKVFCPPRENEGRMRTPYEWVFHFNRKAVKCVEWMPCKSAGELRHVSAQRDPKTNKIRHTETPGFTKDSQVPYGIIRATQHARRGNPHVAMFPVGLPETLIKTWPGDVYEPFCGSGTTIIACENLKRRCFAIEISPAYCAVAIDRWAQHAGGVPELTA